MRIKDQLNRFLIESAGVRGMLLHLDETWQEARDSVDYPVPVEKVLGEAFVAASLLAATIKFDGKMTLQIRGEGPVHLLVVQVTSAQKIRGLAKWSAVPEGDTLLDLFGAGARMSITVEAKGAEPHQGIVALEGEALGQALENYFRISEQLDTTLMLAVQGEQAAGFLLQRLPEKTVDIDGWNRAVKLAATLRAEELLALEASSTLHRLYHSEDVRVFDPASVQFECSCSRERTDGLIIGLGRAEADSILLEQNQIEIICEFCNATYRYDSIDVATLFTDQALDSDSMDDPEFQTLH